MARLVFFMVLLIGAAGCAARGPYVATGRRADGDAQRRPGVWSSSSRSTCAGGSQFDDPVLDQLVTRGLSTNHDVRIAVARVQQARAVFDEVSRDRFPTVGAGASVERRDQVVPGFTDGAAGPDDLSGGLRRILGARPVWPGALADPVRSGHGAELRGNGRRCAREHRGRDREELLRDSRPSAAVGRRRTQPGEPAGNVAAGPSAARRRFRRRAGCRQRRRAGRRHRGQHSADSIGHGAARASARRADRDSARRAWR